MVKNILIPNDLFAAHHNITPESAFPSSCTAIKHLHAHSLITADQVVHLQDLLLLLLSWKVVSDSLQPHGLQHSRLPCPSQLLELAQTYVLQISDAIHPSHTLLSPPPAFNFSQHQGLFQWVSSSHQVAKVLEVQFSISLSNEYSGLISFRIDWFDLLAVQGTPKSRLQHHNWEASILWPSTFFVV